MTALISTLGEVMTAIFEQIGTIASTIDGTPLLLFTVGLPFPRGLHLHLWPSSLLVIDGGAFYAGSFCYSYRYGFSAL